MRSALISAVPLLRPNQEALSAGGGGGKTWASGFPFLVMRIGCPVFKTFSKRAKQVALNFDTATVFILDNILLWSLTMVNTSNCPGCRGCKRWSFPYGGTRSIPFVP